MDRNRRWGACEDGGWLAARHGDAGRARDFQEAASPNVVLFAWSLFLLARNAGDRFPLRRVEGLAGLVLGIYLIHPLVLEGLWWAGLPVDRFHPAVSIPLVSAVAFAVSAALAALIARTPVLRRTI